jgi:hypothetical protein
MSPLERMRFIRSLDMPGRFKAVLWIINAHADKDGKGWPSRALITKESGFSYGNAYEAVEWLCKIGLILRVPRQGKSAVLTMTFEQYLTALSTPSHPDGPPRHTLTPKLYTKCARPKPKPKPKPKPDPTDSPRFDASAPPDRRCPKCGAASLNLKPGALCELHTRKPGSNVLPFPEAKPRP